MNTHYDERARTLAVLNGVSIITVASWAVLYVISTIIFGYYTGGPLDTYVLITLAQVLPFVLIHLLGSRGYVNVGGVLWVGSFFAVMMATVLVALHLYFIPLVVGVLLLIITSSLLFGAKAAWASAVVLTALEIGLATSIGRLGIESTVLTLLVLNFMVAGLMAYIHHERAAVRAGRARLEGILASSPDAVMLVDGDGLITMASHHVQTVTGRKAQACVGQPLAACLQNGTKLKAMLAALTPASTPSRFEMVVVHPDGTPIDVDAALVPLVEEGHITGAIISLRDITVLKDAERLKETLIANVSHELRTPLASLKIHHDLLSLNPDDAARYVPRLKRETRRLQTLVESLLSLSVLDQQPYHMVRDAMDLNPLVRDLVEDRQEVAQANDLSLSTELSPSPVVINGDQNLITQAVSVLLTNALNYTPPGGTVTLRVIRRSCGFGCAGVAVEDTGPGISLEDQQPLFERFFRGEAAQTSNAPGTGLGLSIAKAVAEKHGGSIEVSSTPGHGSTFTLWFPVEA
ncbi:MAG: ATP-binding protein [Anaerolineae bacterium]